MKSMIGTRGVYGFRKDGRDKLTYNAYDSYVAYLGKHVLKFCLKHSIQELNHLCDRIILIEHNTIPTQDDIRACIDNGWYEGVGTNVKWFDLLGGIQGNLEVLFRAKKAFMMNDKTFIENSFYCSYGYIINLDLNMLEFRTGFQRFPDYSNRYGVDPVDDYYPCKLMRGYMLPLDKTVDWYIEDMKSSEKKIEIVY